MARRIVPARRGFVRSAQRCVLLPIEARRPRGRHGNRRRVRPPRRWGFGGHSGSGDTMATRHVYAPCALPRAWKAAERARRPW